MRLGIAIYLKVRMGVRGFDFGSRNFDFSSKVQEACFSQVCDSFHVQ